MSSIDWFSLNLGMFLMHAVCMTRIHLVRQQYPLVHNVLFNPYSGDIILESEKWSSFVKSSFKLGGARKPKLVPFHIAESDVGNYNVLGTSAPQGMVIQPNNFNPDETFVDQHLGKNFQLLGSNNIKVFDAHSYIDFTQIFV